MLPYHTLRKIAIYGGFISLGGAIYFTEKMQTNFRQLEYYKKSLMLLRKYRPAVDIFGEPIKSKRLDFGDTVNNIVDGKNAKLAIPVKGPKDKGTLFCLASRQNIGDSWDIVKLDLEVDSTKRKWTFYEKPTKNVILKYNSKTEHQRTDSSTV